MRTPILTSEQQAELAVVQAECKDAWPTATVGERLALTRKLSIYTYGCQHLSAKDMRVLSTFPVRTGTLADDEDEDERWYLSQLSS